MTPLSAGPHQLSVPSKTVSPYSIIIATIISKGCLNVFDWVLYPSNIICCLLLQSQLHKLTASFTWNNCGKIQPCSYKSIFLSFFCPIVLRMSAPNDCDAIGECACYWEPWPSWHGGKTDYHFHSVCVVGALELTSELLLPLLDWSCQSCSAHVCVITTTNTSTSTVFPD